MESIGEVRALAVDDDRGSFDCSRPSLNNWLIRHAWRNQQSGASRTYVLPGSEPQSIAGFLALSAGDIRRGHLPKRNQRNLPEPVPVVVLGQLAVDRQYQGKGLSRVLLAYAFTSVVHVAQNVGVFGLVTHPLDDRLREFYRRYGFDPLDGDPKGAMMVRIRDLKSENVG